MSGGDWLRARAALTPGATALIDGERRCSFRDLDAAADRCASALRADSMLREGDAVATLARNGIAHVTALFAVLRAGAVAVPLNTRLAAPELARQARLAAVRLIIADEDRRGDAASAGLPVIGLDALAGGAGSGGHPASESPSADPGPGACPARGDRRVCILFSSGSSGTPKAVPLTEANLAASARASTAHLATGPGDNWLCVLPLFHVGGFSILTRAVIDGFAVTLAPGFEPAGVSALVRDRRVTIASLVPVMLSRLLEDPAFTASACPSLRAILLGGAPAAPPLLREAARRGLPLLPTYGLTETCSQVATAPYASRFEAPDGAAQPLEGARLEIRGEGGSALPAGASGEIWVAGPMLTRGYLDGDASAFRDGWFRTGDIGSMDAAGRLRVEGRRDEMIITGGEKVAPAEVEQVLLAHPRVADAAVYGRPDAEWGQRVCACVVPAGAVPPDAEDLDRHCRASLAGYKVPRRWRIVAEIPRNAAGKVNRTRLAAETD